jgi:YbgC/YbaW family acyl-CoA thioester hydrolase
MWGDLDSLGIVFYPRFYEWMDASGHLFLESLGLSLGDLWKERNIQFGLVETSCRYLSPGRYHDEIEIVTSIGDLKEKTVLLSHLIRCPSDDRVLVEGVEVRICMDVSDPLHLMAVKIPEDIYPILQKARGRC